VTAPVLAGLSLIRVDAGLRGSAVYQHGDHELLVWDMAGDGALSLQCDCDLTPVELADTLGVPRERLDTDEFRISARMVAERLFEVDPEHPVAIATLAFLGT
jgi:hypothetical protein